MRKKPLFTRSVDRFFQRRFHRGAVIFGVFALATSCIEPGVPNDKLDDPETGGGSSNSSGGASIGGVSQGGATANPTGGTDPKGPGGGGGEGGALPLLPGEEGIDPNDPPQAEIGVNRPEMHSHFEIDSNNNRSQDATDVEFDWGFNTDRPIVRPCVSGRIAVVGIVREPHFWLASHDDFIWEPHDAQHNRFFVTGKGTIGQPLFFHGKMTSFVQGAFYHDEDDSESWQPGRDPLWNFGITGVAVVGYFGRKNRRGELLEDLGVFDEGTWHLDLDGNRIWSPPPDGGDVSFEYGKGGDYPFTGNFSGDGRSEIGVFRDGQWFSDTDNDWSLDSEDESWFFGQPGDTPLVASRGWYEDCR